MAGLDLNNQINWEDVQEDYGGLAGELDYDLELIVMDEGTSSLRAEVHIFVGALVFLLIICSPPWFVDLFCQRTNLTSMCMLKLSLALDAVMAVDAEAPAAETPAVVA